MALSNVTSQSSENLTNAISPGDTWGEISSSIFMKFIFVLEGAVILFVTFFLIKLIKKYFAKIETTHEQQRTALNLLEKITVGFVMVVGLTLALKVVGLDISLLVSVCLLGLSYGLKDVIKNYIAGILLSLKSPFKIGDTVKIKQFVGKIEKMELQSTSIKTFDNRDITIYNSDILNQSIQNYSRYPMKRIELNVNLGYGTDIEKATRIFNKILEADQSILKTPKHTISFKGFSKDFITVQLKFWLQIPSNFLKIRTDLAYKIYKAFDEASLISPYARETDPKEGFSMDENRKKRTQDFYTSPMFANLDTAPAAADQLAPQPGPLAPEFVDADEPSVEEDDMF